MTNVNTVLDNIATLRAANGGEANRLQYALANVSTQITNLTAANGRIMDVDIAAESANLAKQQILVQASASMVAQANTANNVALTAAAITQVMKHTVYSFLSANISSGRAARMSFTQIQNKSRRINNMSLTINSNIAATRASYFLASNIKTYKKV